MVKLSICVDHVAAIRHMADRNEPDPIASVVLAQLGGAEGITVSWFSDNKNFQEQEFSILRQLIHTHMNLIITPADEIVQNALTLHPDMVTLVPDGYQGAGLNNDWVHTGWPETDTTGRALEQTVDALQRHNILVNMLIRPSAADVRYCSQLKVDYVHIDTSVYATAEDAEQEHQSLNELASTAKVASRLNMGVTMGRGISYRNVQDIAGIWEVEEVVVGHAVMSKAMAIGFERAVRDLVDIIRHAPGRPGD